MDGETLEHECLPRLVRIDFLGPGGQLLFAAKPVWAERM